jgi:hypothetical protein
VLARCRYRDSDGVTRRVQRLGPPDEYDQPNPAAEIFARDLAVLSYAAAVYRPSRSLLRWRQMPFRPNRHPLRAPDNTTVLARVLTRVSVLFAAGPWSSRRDLLMCSP